MSHDPLQPGWTGLLPMAKPFAHALNRMEARAAVHPDALQARALHLLEARFGAGEAPRSVFAAGGVGLVSEHTHYFDGFALMLPLAQGTAVAVRPTRNRSAVAFEEQAAVPLEAGARSAAVRVVHEVVRRSGWASVEVAVASSVPSCFQDARLSSLAVALAQGVQSRQEEAEASRRAGLDLLAEALRAALYPFSLAYLITAYDGQPGTYTLVDTHTLEHRALEALPEAQAAWGLLDPGTGQVGAGRGRALQRRADRALAHLQERGFPIASFRYLEHRDLAAALAAAAPEHRATIHYLVTENRRVVNLVRAVVGRDAQKVGALLRTSYAARREWEGTRQAEDAAHTVAEAMALEGVLGTTLTGHARSLLVLGRPALLPIALDRMEDAVTAQTQRPAATMLL